MNSITKKYKYIDNIFFDTEINTFVCEDDEKKWSISELRSKAQKLSHTLLNKGINCSDRVGIMCDNSSKLIIAIMGVARIGAIPVIISPKLPNSSVINILNKTQTKLVYTHVKDTESNFIKERLTNTSDEIIAWGKNDSKRENINIKNNNIHRNKDDIAILLPTSGSSGNVKIVALSHSAVLNNINSIISYMHPDQKDIFYIAKTMVHSSTLIGEVFVAVTVGAKIISKNQYVPIRSMLQRVASSKTTIMCVNPTILSLICETNIVGMDFPNLKSVYTSGSVATEKILKNAKKTFGKANVYNVYGLTEAGPRVAAQRYGEKNNIGSVGKAIKNVEILILNRKGKICKEGEIGEVYVKSPSIMTKYWEDEEETNDKLKGITLKTGDLGYWDRDEELHIVGRKDEMIICGAHNINPNAVESIIEQYSKGIRCSVFGIPDLILGTKIICLVKGEVDIAKLYDYCKKNLAIYECPSQIYKCDSLPLTSSGKKYRYKAMELYRSLITRN